MVKTHADFIAWTNTSGGLWSAPLNWDPNQLPGPADVVRITSNGNYVVTRDVDATLNRLIIGGLSSGYRTLSNSGHTLTLTNNSIVGTNAIFSQSGGTLAASELLSVSGVFNWTGGDISGALTVEPTGVLNLSGSSQKNLMEALTNAGTIHWTNTGNLVLWNLNGGGYLGAIYNLAGGLFDIQNDQLLGCACYGSEFFNNAGTVRKSAGPGPATVSVAFTNSGTVEAQSGTLQFNGVYSNRPTSTLTILLSGVSYGQIAFSSPPSFDGTFAVRLRDGYRPNLGDAFTVLTNPSSLNTFACLSGLDLGDGLRPQPKFTATSLVLTVVRYATNIVPQLFISASPRLSAVTWPLGFPDWTLQSCTDLASPSWVPVPQACGNSALLPTTSSG